MTGAYRLADGVLRAELDGEAVLLNPDTGVYHLLNATGKQLVDLFQDGLSVEEAVARIARSTGVASERVGEDAETFVDEMRLRNLLVDLEPSA